MTESTDMRQMTQLGRSIEAGSFRIVDEEAGSHNFTPEQWQIIASLLADRGILPLLDFAYQGFATGLREDAHVVDAATHVRGVRSARRRAAGAGPRGRVEARLRGGRIGPALALCQRHRRG